MRPVDALEHAVDAVRQIGDLRLPGGTREPSAELDGPIARVSLVTRSRGCNVWSTACRAPRADANAAKRQSRAAAMTRTPKGIK